MSRYTMYLRFTLLLALLAAAAIVLGNEPWGPW
jgi:hypothetical protein